MADALSTLEQLSQDIGRLAEAIDRCRKRRIPPEIVQPTARAIARAYFESVRTELAVVQGREALVTEIDTGIQTVLDMSSTSSEKGEHKHIVDELRRLLLEATVDVMKSRGARRLVLSQTEAAILETLTKVLPGAAASYEQVLRDVQRGEHVSWRGPANELREILREVIHYLAPDDKVMAAPGYRHEDGETRPTQRQRVRFILRARRGSAAGVEVAIGSLDAVDEAVAVLARSTYTRGNVSAHSNTGNAEIRNLKRYVDALVGELLEIH